VTDATVFTPAVPRAEALRAALLAALLAVVPGGGCVSRTLFISSDPAGAEVRLNGEPVGPAGPDIHGDVVVGRTPVAVAFRHYGMYSVELRAPGRETLLAELDLAPPLYARFPLCLFSELLWPGTIRDERRFTFVLRPSRAPGRAALLARAAEALDAFAADVRSGRQ